MGPGCLAPTHPMSFPPWPWPWHLKVIKKNEIKGSLKLKIKIADHQNEDTGAFYFWWSTSTFIFNFRIHDLCVCVYPITSILSWLYVGLQNSVYMYPIGHHSMLVSCWAVIADEEPAWKQHCVRKVTSKNEFAPNAPKSGAIAQASAGRANLIKCATRK